jgi:hypothetical protein
MFPPQRTPDLNVLLQNVYMLLSSAGDHFSGHAVTAPHKSKTRVAMQLAINPPEDAKPAITGFIRGYAAGSGWSASSFSFKKNRLEFSCCPSP